MDLAKTLYKTENFSINSYQYKNVGKDLQIWNFFWQAVVDPLFQPSLFLPQGYIFSKAVFLTASLQVRGIGRSARYLTTCCSYSTSAHAYHITQLRTG